MGRLAIYPDGVVACATFPEDTKDLLQATGPFTLCIADPPYNAITKEKWDRSTVPLQIHQCQHVAAHCVPGAALYWFGGYGSPGNRVFFRWLCELEQTTSWQMAALVTWHKRRAYGVQWNYLSTREEIAYCVLGDIKHPRTFHVPYTSVLRGYPGYDPAHPAHDDRLRRTMVWPDVTELLRGKVHPCEKPTALLRIPIEVHTDPGDTVLDLFSGSGACSQAARELGRRFVAIESDPTYWDGIVGRLGAPESVVDF